MTKINNKKSVTNLIVAVSAVALITMMSLILFAGCGGTNPVGTWTLDRVVVDGTTYRADDENKGDYASAFENEIVLNEDETGTVKLDADDATEATWAQTDNVITITADEQELQFTLNGTELIYDTDDGNTRYFYVKKSS